EEVDPAEPDLPGGHPSRRHVEDAHDRLGGDALPRARLAEHGERLPGVHAVADAVDRLGDARPGVEFDVEVLHLEQGSRAVRAGAAAQRLGEHFHHAVPPQRSFGSRASRTAPPSMTKVSTHRERNPAGKSSACAPERMYWA